MVVLGDGGGGAGHQEEQAGEEGNPGFAKPSGEIQYGLNAKQRKVNRI